MKKELSILMVFVIAVQIQWGSGYLIHYFVDSKAYQELCKNKDAPELNCDGKCVLAQKIKQTKSKQLSINLLPISFEFTFTFFSTSFQIMQFNGYKKNSIYIFFYEFLGSIEVFKPPRGFFSYQVS